MCRKVIFITGATENTGLAIAEHFAGNGYDVAISSRDSIKAEKTADMLREKYNTKAKGYALNLKDVDDIKRVFLEIKKDFGRLDTFVANSANQGVGLELLTATPEAFDDVISVNLRGTYFCCQQAALIMKEQNKGAIVIIGSVHYKAGICGRGAYAASKGGLASLTRSMAVELGKYNIRANYIVAGAIYTNRWDMLPEEARANRRKNYPIGRESTGQDIANAVYYLGTDLSATVTGSDLTVDSGVGACLLPYNGGQV